MDPVSGGIGIAAATITALQGLITFCSNYQSRSEDISQLKEEAERLQAFFFEIRKLENGQQPSKSRQKEILVKCVASCEACTRKFADMYSKYTTLEQTPSGSSARARNIWRGVKYGFTKPKFDEMRDQMHGMHSEVSNLLAFLNNTTLEEGFTRVSSDMSLAFSRTSSELQAQDTQLKLGFSNISSEVQAQGQLITMGLSDVSSQVQTHGEQIAVQISAEIRSQFDDMQNLLKNDLSTRRRTLPMSSSSQSDGNHSLPETQYLPPCPPSAPESNTESSSDPAMLLLPPNTPPISEAVTTGHKSILASRCRCPPNTRHKKECPFSIRPQRTNVSSKEISVLNLRIKWNLDVEYSQHARFRDFRIYPTLTMRAVVDKSPAFDIVKQASRMLNMGLMRDQLEKIFESYLFQLYECFVNGQAGPTDVDLVGQTLLHHITAPASEEKIPALLQFVQGLVEFGVPINEGPRSPLLHLMTDFNLTASEVPNHIKLARGLMQYGGELVSDRSRPFDGIGGSHNLLLSNRNLYGIKCFEDYGPLSQAILEEDEGEVRYWLEKSEDYILERGPGDETPVHLSVAWPKGIRLLVELGKAQFQSVVPNKDRNSKTALSYAQDKKCVESVRLLLEHDFSIDLEDIDLRYTSTGRNSMPLELVRATCEAIAARRRHLAELASKSLPIDVMTRLKTSHQPLIQEKASEISKALEEHQVKTPWVASTTIQGSVYHSRYIYSMAAQMLFESGFDKTNIEMNGLTPLMVMEVGQRATSELVEVLNMTEWHSLHGADIYQALPSAVCHASALSGSEDQYYRVNQRIAYLLGEKLWTFSIDRSISQHPTLQNILSDTTDPCSCYCMPRGCSPVSLLTRSGLETGMQLGAQVVWQSPRAVTNHLDTFIDCYLEWLETIVSDAAVSKQGVQEIVRVMTFTKLGMKHTCCRWHGWRRDTKECPSGSYHPFVEGKDRLVSTENAEDMTEIQEEDWYLKLLLDELMEDFETQLGKFNGPLRDFIYNYWWMKMDKIEQEEEALSAEELEAIAATGVVLYAN